MAILHHVSIGIAYYPKHGVTADKLLEAAERALEWQRWVARTGSSLRHERGMERDLQIIE